MSEFWAFQGDTLTVSGSGFAGATDVQSGGGSVPFTVVSDSTLTIPVRESLSAAPLTVTAGGQTSAPTPLGDFVQEGFTYPPIVKVQLPVQCTLGADVFSASLGAVFVYDGKYPRLSGPQYAYQMVLPEPYRPYADSAVQLGEFRATLAVGGSVSAGPLARLSGEGTVTSVETDVTGAVESSLDLASAAAVPATFPIASSVDGNPLAFGVGNLASTVIHTRPEPQLVSIRLRGYHAEVGLVGGGTTRLDCVPSSSSGGTLLQLNTFPRSSPTPTPTVDPQPQDVTYAYSVAGSATLKTLTKGSLPLRGGASMTLNLTTGAVAGDVTLEPTKANLVTLGFLPVEASVAFVPTGQATGRLDANDGLAASLKARIKIPSIKLFGLELGGGAGCQAKNQSLINLASLGRFVPTTGGVLTGTFAISDLVNCGVLTGLVSPLTAGPGNAITLQLTPAP